MRHFIKSLLVAALATLTTACSAAEDGAGDAAIHEAKALEIFTKVISIRSVLGHGKMPELATYLADEFRAAGFPEDDIHLLSFALPDEEIAALVVRYRGDGSSGKRPVMVAAHMDVVEALPEDWERDPYTLTEDEGYYFGRGTADNKLGVTTLTTTFLRLKSEGFVPNRDLILVFSGDEETGMVSTRALVNEHLALTNAEFALNSDAGGGVIGEDGEPQVYRIQAAEKTYVTYEMTVRNPGGHSSRPRADNAIYELAQAVGNIQAYAFPVMSTELTRSYFRETGKRAPGDLGTAMVAFAEDPTNEAAIATLSADPGYVGNIRTTCVATRLKGGHADNALPQSATVTVNCRIFPGTSVDEVRDTLLEVAANPEIEITMLGDPTASSESPLRDDVMSAIVKTVHARYPGLPVIPYMESGGTDGMHYRAAGIPSYGISGRFMKTSDMFAHGLNERIPVASLNDALEHWYLILHEVAGK